MLFTERQPFADAILHKSEPLLGVFKLEQGCDKLLLALGWGHGLYHAHWAGKGKSVAMDAGSSTMGT